MEKNKSKSTTGYGLEALNDTALEVEERNKRSRSIIIFNAPESEAEETHEKHLADLGLMETICNELTIDKKTVKTQRLNPGQNKPVTKPLPLRVDFQDTNTVTQIMKKAKNLGNSKSPVLKNLSLAPDLTPLQRELRKELRTEAKRRNETEEDQSKIWVVTYKSKLVKTTKKQMII